MTYEEIRLGYRKHAILAQFYRWFQIYENPEVPVENALDILDADVALKSGLGEGKGHDAYRQRIGKLPKTWKNAHFPRNVMVITRDDGRAALAADVTYVNVGMKPGGIRTAELSYTMVLKNSIGVLPKITKVEISQSSEGTAEAFADAYMTNRALSLVHYWLTLIEDPASRIEPFREIMTPGLSLNFSNGEVTYATVFDNWFRRFSSAFSAGTHEVQDFKCITISPTEFEMTALFDWAGIVHNGTEMANKTKQRWVITDDPTQRFARITFIDVEVVVALERRMVS